MTKWLCRELFTLAAVVVALTLVSGPALADTSGQAGRTAGTNTNTAKPASTVVSRLDQRAVALQERAQATQAAYDVARDRVAEVSAHLATLEDQAAQSAAKADALYEQISNSSPGLFGSIKNWVTGSESDVDKAADAVAGAQHMQELVGVARSGLQEAATAAEQAHRAAADAASAAAEMTDAAAARAAAAIATRQSRFRSSYSAGSAQQKKRNRTALDAWHGYLNRLARAHVVPPAASSLAKPHKLTGELRPVSDDSGRPVPGVAQVRTAKGVRVQVLSAATIRAVSDAFSKVGMPDAAHPNSAVAYDCGGLTHQVWDAARVKVPANDLAQWQQVHSVPARQVTIGDTVFFRDGAGYGTGVFVGKNRVIAYDAATGEVAVRVVPKKRIFGADRATLPTGDETSVKQVPAAMTDACTTTAAADTTHVAGVWGYPVAQGSYTLSAGFDQVGGLWSSGAHTGQDFAAPIGTPVFASRAGTVSLEKVAWAGVLVRIDHGGGVESLYAHMSRIDVTPGQQVKAGELIGAVGDRGNTTGPHLHFEIRIDDRAVDPMPLLDPSAAQPSYGGNGEIAEASLCPVAQGTQMLRCDAAVDYRLMDAAFADHFGVPLCITDSYRSLQVQEHLAKIKPRLAAVPGTSNHGWGLAVDLCGGVETFATPEHEWLVANAARFGWDHPAWAEAGGNRPEPWHFEFAAGA